jgi:phosphatidylglycerophosphate synthase
MADDAWLIFENGKWREAACDPASPCTRFSEIRFYYSNLADYARVAMCLLAAVTLAFRQPLATALLIIGSTLLDWVDGPLAHAHNQCTIFGSGVDWLADILAQIITLVWVAQLAPALAPILVFATAIELTNCIFDFATTATGRYPVLNRQGGFGIILDWSMPGGSYTPFGTALWLAYPLFVIAGCLDLSWPVRTELTSGVLRGSEVLLLVPAALYVWCELAYVRFIIGKWREAPRQASPSSFNDGPRGMECLGVLPENHRDLLRRAWTQGMQKMASEWQAGLDRKAVFWVNLWQRSGSGEKIAIDCIEELDGWARELVARHYDNSVVELDGYGLIANPVGSSAQAWHIDYTLDYSTIFIPLTEVSVENSLQYAVLPRSLPPDAYQRATADLNAVDLPALARTGEWVSVRQLLAPPFTLIKMDFGAIHRGVANTGNYHRVLFWVSAKKRGALLPPEPVLQTIAATSGDGQSRAVTEVSA